MFIKILSKRSSFDKIYIKIVIQNTSIFNLLKMYVKEFQFWYIFKLESKNSPLFIGAIRNKKSRNQISRN